MVIYNPTHSHLHYELQNTSCYWRVMGMLQVQKNLTFQDSVKSTLPLLASSMFMADLSMGIISHPYILREDIGQMTENTQTAQNWQSQDIYRQRSVSHRNLSYCFLWTSVVLLDWDTELVWCLFFPSEAQWVGTPVRTYSKWRCCLWLELCLQHGEFPEVFSNPSIALMLPGSFQAWSTLQENLP